MRGEEATERRRMNRTFKRRVARQEKRTMNRIWGREQGAKHNHEERATAQKPSGTEKMKQTRTQWIATLNIRGANKPGTREEVEAWMKDHDIKILLLQETRGKHNSREARKTHTWYFSSENPMNPNFVTGTAIVIENKLVKHINKMMPVNDRHANN